MTAVNVVTTQIANNLLAVLVAAPAVVTAPADKPRAPAARKTAAKGWAP